MIILTIKLLILALFICYSIIEGMREGIYYHYKIKTFHTDLGEHNLFTVQRSIVGLFILGIFTYMNNNFVHGCFEILPLVFMFPYFHDGAYYMVRNDADNKIYKKRWKDDSSTSTAVLEIKYPYRLVAFIFGLISFVALITIALLK